MRALNPDALCAQIFRELVGLLGGRVRTVFSAATT